MKTSHAFMVGGTAAAILATGWATAPKADESVSYTTSTSDDSADSSDSSDDSGLTLDEGAEPDAAPESSDDLGETPEQGALPEGGGHGGHGAPPGGGGESSGTLDEDALSAGDTESADGSTYTGASVQTRYGSFSVQITVVDGEVTAVSMVESGQTDHESLQINSYALPQLMQEVLDTQSADVSYVSGASYTSQGFAQSVADAFDQAGL